MIGFCLYIPTFHNEMFWDDDDFILKNTYVHDLNKWSYYFKENVIAGTGLVSNYWRPVLLTVFGIEYKLFGTSVEGYHIVSTVFHSLDGVLLFILLYRVFKKKWIAFFTSVLFVIHPVQTESVAYVNSLGDSLSVFFMLLGLNIFNLSLKKRAFSYTFIGLSCGALLCYILALMSKETAIIMPALAAAIVICTNNQKIFEKLKLVSLKTSYLWLVGIVYVIARATVLNFKNSFNLYDQATLYSESIVIRTFTFFKVLVVYIGLLFWPQKLHMERSLESVTTVFNPWFIGGVLIFVSLAAVAYKLYKEYPYITFGILWFCIGLAPTSNVLVPINGVLYEHWLYLPSIGLFLAVCTGLAIVFKKYAVIKPALYFVCTIGLVALGWRGVLRMQEWSSAIRFYEQTIQFAPTSYRILNNLGMEYAEVHKPEKAVLYYDKAITADPSNPVALYNKSNTLLGLGKTTEAITGYERAIQNDPEFIYAYQNLITIYLQTKDYTNAKAVVEQYLQVYPNDPQALSLLKQLSNQ